MAKSISYPNKSRPAFFGILVRTVLAAALTVPCIVSAKVRINAVEVNVDHSHTRVVLESDSVIRFTFFSLKNPDRLLLDLEEAVLNSVLADIFRKIDTAHPYLKPIRIGRSENGAVRLEFDFKFNALPESQILTYKPDGTHGYRLLLDINPIKATQVNLSEAPLFSALVSTPPSPSTFKRDASKVQGGEQNSAQALPTNSKDVEIKDLLPRNTFRSRKSLTDPKSMPEAASVSAKFEELLFEVRINKQGPGDVVLILRDSDKRILASADDLTKWRLHVPKGAPVMHGGIAFHHLDNLNGMTYFANDSDQTLGINAEVDLFGPTVLNGMESGHSTPTMPKPGGFFNYDIFADATNGTHRLSGLVEAGAFGPWGTGVTTFLGNNQPLNGNRLVRLDSTWVRDFPEDRKTLRLGDTITSPSSWGRSVRFGGVQWGSNFATQPGFISFPLPSLAGQAALPSTLDYYFDGARRLQRDVPSGPFSIQDLPVVTGQGEARLVVRDVLGREQVITQRFYTSPQLLRKGLQAYSYDVGFLRNNFGIESNAYGQFMAVGTHRLGISDAFTGEIHGEWLREQQTLGLGSAYVLPSVGLLSGSLAASHNRQGAGALMSLGLTHQSNPFGFGVNTQRTTENFTQLGLTSGGPAPKQVSQVFASVGTAAYGSFSVSYASQQWRDRADVRLASATYNVSMGRLGTLGVSLIRLLGEDKKTVFSAILTIPIDGRTTASASTIVQPEGNQSAIQMQRSLPAGSGMGYRLLAGTAGSTSRQEAGIIAQNDVGTYSLEAGKAQGQSAVRGYASGGLAILGGNAFLTRRINESFGVVEVPGYSNVRVYADNQQVGRTDKNGMVLLPHMRPYQKNAIRIDESDLPLDARIDATELNAVPYFRSAVRMKLPVKKSQGALIQVMLGPDVPLPPGSIAHIAGADEEFPTGLRGEIYLTGLNKTNRVTVTWQEQSCSFDVLFDESTDPVPNLGVFQCAGQKQ